MTRMTGRVEKVWIKPDQDGAPPLPQERIELVTGKGVRGDRHFGDPRRPARQILLVDQGELDILGLEPGVLREQITVDFPGLQQLDAGDIVEIGSAAIEITGDCAPCRTMAGYLREDPEAFVNRAMRKRGMLGKIVADGLIAAGDEVRLRGQA